MQHIFENSIQHSFFGICFLFIFFCKFLSLNFCNSPLQSPPHPLFSRRLFSFEILSLLLQVWVLGIIVSQSSTEFSKASLKCFVRVMATIHLCHWSTVLFQAERNKWVLAYGCSMAITNKAHVLATVLLQNQCYEIFFKQQCLTKGYQKICIFVLVLSCFFFSGEQCPPCTGYQEAMQNVRISWQPNARKKL